MPRTLNRYVLLEQIASTGMATVYRAKDPEQADEIALKVFRPLISENLSAMDSLSIEIDRIVGIQNSSVIRVFEKGNEEQTHWIAMEFSQYPTLDQLLTHTFTLAQTMNVLEQLCTVINDLGATGLNHGNIKPSNIFVNPEDGSIKVGDFGMGALSKALPQNLRESSNTPLPAYSAPELSDSVSFNAVTDVYSIGIIAYQMFTGKTPFLSTDRNAIRNSQINSASTPVSQLNKDLPKEMDAVFNKVLSPHPAIRYQTASNFMDEIKIALPNYNIGKTSFPDNKKPESQERMPGLEVEQTLTKEEDLPKIICTVCGQENHHTRGWCLKCRSVLSRVGILEGSGVASPQERLAKKEHANRIRRTFLGAIFLSVLTFTTVQFMDITLPLKPPSSNITATSEQGEWAMVHRTFEGLSPIPSESASITGNIKWTFETTTQIVSTPAVKGDKVYLTTQDRRVVALDKNTGELIWQYTTAAPIDSSPTVANNMVFFGARSKRVIALNALTGEQIWEFVTDGNPTSGSPLVKGGVVYIGSGIGKLYALDALTGDMMWEYVTRDWVTNTPALSDNLLVLASMDGRVTIHDTNTGKRRFSFRGLGPHIFGSPTINGDSAYVTYRNGYVVSVNLHEEEILFYSRYYRLRLQLWLWGIWNDHPGLPKGVNWVRPLGSTIHVATAADSEKLYVPTESGLLHALDTQTGKRLWIYDARPLQLSSPTIIENTILITDGKGYLHSIDKETGEQQWRIRVAQNVTSIPVVADGVLYVASKDGTLYAIE